MRIVADYLFINLRNFVPAAINLILIPIYLQAISLKEFGYLTILLVLTNLLTLLMSTQFASALLKFLNQFPQDPTWKHRYISSLFMLTLVLSVVTGSAFLLSGGVIHQLFTEIETGVFTLLWPYITGIAFIQVYRSFFEHLLRAERNTRRLFYSALIQAVISLLMTLVYLWFGWLSLQSIVLINIVALAASTLFLLWPCLGYLGFEWANSEPLGASIRYSLGLLPHSISKFIMQHADKILLLKFLSAEEVAIYAILMKVASVFERIVSSGGQALMPVLLSQKDDRIETAAADSLDSTQVFYAICLLFACVALPWVVGFMSMEAHLYWPVGALLLFSPLISNFRFFYSNQLFAREKTAWVSLGSIFVAMLSVLLNFLLIPLLGIWGAALSYVSVHGINLIVTRHMLYLKTASTFKINRPLHSLLLMASSVVVLILIIDYKIGLLAALIAVAIMAYHGANKTLAGQVVRRWITNRSR